jgi:hypothetical protein
MDNIFARNRWFLVSIVPKWHELYSSDFLLPLNGFIEAWLSPGCRSIVVGIGYLHRT